jgi:ATP-dependent helicase/nuclease subunit A
MLDSPYQIDGRSCTPQAFYDLACDPTRHAVVEACAGAGKTWMLVARMARALLLGAEPDGILAITFTKKAAAEMRQRLLGLLQQWAELDDEGLRQELALRGLARADAALLGAARGLYAKVLHSERAIQVRTFHSWFAQLLRHAPMEVFRQLELPAQHELLEDDAPACAAAWPLFLAQVQADAALLADYQAAVAALGRASCQEALMTALARRAELSRADEAGVLAQSLAPVAQVAPRFAAWSPGESPWQQVPAFEQALWAAAQALGRHSKSDASVRNGEALARALSDGDWRAAGAVLRTQTGAPRSRGLSTAEPEVMAQAQAWWEEWADALHQSRCLAHQARMLRLSKALMATYTALKRQRAWVDMNDLEAAATHLLADGAIAAWVQQRLDQRVQQLLIDEFQDTNPVQWHALRAWLAAYAGAGGGGQDLRVFIVGDPKQSIYRFRRADPRVFAQAREFLREALGAHALSCDHTRRCAIGVVQACNAVMATRPREGETAVDYRPHSTASTEPGWVARLPLVQAAAPEVGEAQVAWRDSLTQPRDVARFSAAAQEAQALAAWLATQIKAGRWRPQDVMVLARTNARLASLHEALNNLGVASAFAEKTAMAAAPVVADVAALIDAATAHSHDLSLARALKSPMFGASDEVLMALARAQAQQPKDTSWWATLQSPEVLQVLPRDWDAEVWAATAQAWAADWRALAERLQQWPVHDVLVWWFEHRQVAQAYARAVPAALQASVRAQLSAVLAHSQSLGSGRFITPYAWVRDLRSPEREVAWPVPQEAVRLLTIHGAKGLESKVVVLMDSHAPPKRAQGMNVLFDWPLTQDHPQRVVFVMREKAPPLCARELLAREQLARQAEDSNLLYVAMTRAEHELWFSAHDSGREASASWYQAATEADLPLWTGDDGALASETPNALRDAGPISTPQVKVKSLPHWPGLRRPSGRMAADLQALPTQGSPVSDEASRLGQALHLLLQWADGGELASPAARATVQVTHGLSADQLDAVCAMAQAIRHGEAAWAWDAVSEGHAELDLAWQGRLLRLDRVVRHRDTGVWWVLDFKANTQPTQSPEWCAQVRDYAQAWAAAHPGEAVRAALVGGDGRCWPLEP